MGLYVNTNVMSINARRSTGRTLKRIAQNFERLSSGLRINSAADDAAGLAISERFTSEIHGLGQALRNANDAISLAQVAEAALSESTAILQRIRQLSIQSANDINSAGDRAALNDEVEQLVDELHRIGENTTFNGSDLLDGTFFDAFFQIGAFARQTVRFRIRDARANAIGRQATQTGIEVPTTALGVGDVVINGVTIRGTNPADDPFSTSFPSGSAIAKAAAINDTTEFHGVTARAMPTRFVGTSRITGGTLSNSDHIIINGKVISALEVKPDDASDSLVDVINDALPQTGVSASLDERGHLVLEAVDGRNIEVEVVGNAGNNLGIAASTVQTAKLNLYSENDYQLAGPNEGNIGFVDNEFVAVNFSEAIDTVSVLSRFDANEALLRVDRALEQVSADRAELGAATNRMNSTLSNLTSILEAAQSARSRIRDADFAFETSDLARNQILQQAGVAVIAQANSAPQQALQLLQATG